MEKDDHTLAQSIRKHNTSHTIPPNLAPFLPRRPTFSLVLHTATEEQGRARRVYWVAVCAARCCLAGVQGIGPPRSISLHATSHDSLRTFFCTPQGLRLLR